MENKWESVFFAGLLILAFLAIVMMYRPTTWAREAWVTIDTQLTGESTGIKVAKLKLSLNEQ